MRRPRLDKLRLEPRRCQTPALPTLARLHPADASTDCERTPVERSFVLTQAGGGQETGRPPDWKETFS